MILLDTNVVIYASDPTSAFYEWAQRTIAASVAGEGAAINSVSLAELYVGDAEPATVARRLRSWGVSILDVPSAAAESCAAAYREYCMRRSRERVGAAPRMPLPDFFIGAHAMIMGWPLATADHGRFGQYFPSVQLIRPR